MIKSSNGEIGIWMDGLVDYWIDEFKARRGSPLIHESTNPLILELIGPRFYCRLMKRISFFLMTALLMAPVAVPAQDAAVEERLNSLSAQIDVLKEARELQNKKIEALEKQVSDLQSQLSKPSGDYASTEELKKLADAIREVDKKRQADSENVAEKLENLRKALVGGGSNSGRRTTVTPPADTPKTTFDPNAPHMEHKVESGETIDGIVAAFRSKGVKVTRAQVLAANPGLKPESLKAGQTIIIPAPAQ